jgi:3-oxo-5-alpha-steroid 4-dehydrogenase 1
LSALSPWFDLIVIGWIAIAVIAFVTLRFLRAAYGRYTAHSRAPLIPAAVGWVAMESVAALLYALFFFTSDRVTHTPSLVLFTLLELHYIHRSFIYPLRARIRGRKMPISILALGAMFNLVNASLLGIWLFHLGPARELSWLVDPRFVIGALLFFVGMAININSDNRLRALRLGNGADYKVPQGGLFRWVSCPNYLGEIVEWCGFALATWSLVGLSFAAWTFANLAPRAFSHHRWYRDNFEDYPEERKALFPYII